jgi:hypothetical protein
MRSDALLVVNELIANATQACSGAIGVAVDANPTGLLLSVTDDCPAPARAGKNGSSLDRVDLG